MTLINHYDNIMFFFNEGMSQRVSSDGPGVASGPSSNRRANSTHSGNKGKRPSALPHNSHVLQKQMSNPKEKEREG